MGRLQADTSWTTCRSLEKKLSVWRLCWISGGYRLEAASGPIALYIVGIRGAQGRSQHYKSGTGTLVESESWLAMADCLGRFGRASHSNPRYHSPTQNFGQVQMHVQRNTCGPCDQIRLVLRLHAICHLARPTAILQSSCRAYAPFTVSSLVEYTRRVAIRPREFACLSQGKATLRVVQPIRPAMLATLGAGSTPVFGARSLASTSPRHVRNTTCIPNTAASVSTLPQVHHDTPWLSAGSLSWKSPTKVQWSSGFLSKAATSSDHVMASRCYHPCTSSPSGTMHSLMALVASLVGHAVYAAGRGVMVPPR